MSSVARDIREFNRFELKYLVTVQGAERLKSALRAYMVPDANGNHSGRYTVASLYYDSPDLRCYQENEAGVRFRRKLRIRCYETGKVLTEETPVFVEVKQRVDRVTQKRRAILPYAEALRLCNDRQIPDHTPDDEAVIEEICAFTWHYNLRPVSIVRYERQAFVGTGYDIGLRVTCDTFLSCQSQQNHLHEAPPGMSMLPPNLVVMEIKVNERIPYWLTDMIAVHGLRRVSFSKYCRSIEAAWNTPSMRWRHLPAERAHNVLSAVPAVFDMRALLESPAPNQGA